MVALCQALFQHTIKSLRYLKGVTTSMEEEMGFNKIMT